MPQILIIDDEEHVRCILRDILHDAGYAVVEARNGLEGCRRFKAAPTDLVITDMLMPEKGGLETIKDLRQLDPEVKIIAMSGGHQTGNPHSLDAARQSGAQGTLRKPFEIHEVLEAIRKVLGP